MFLLSDSVGRKPFLINVPVTLLKMIAVIIGKENEMKKLVSSLEIDFKHTKELLNWKPPI